MSSFGSCAGTSIRGRHHLVEAKNLSPDSASFKALRFFTAGGERFFTPTTGGFLPSVSGIKVVTY
jgi:hypothetical protein